MLRKFAMLIGENYFLSLGFFCVYLSIIVSFEKPLKDLNDLLKLIAIVTLLLIVISRFLYLGKSLWNIISLILISSLIFFVFTMGLMMSSSPSFLFMMLAFFIQMSPLVYLGFMKKDIQNISRNLGQ